MTSKKGEKENIQLGPLTIRIKENQLQSDFFNEPETKRYRNPLGGENIQPDPLAIDNKENQRPLINPTNVTETKKFRNTLGKENIKPDQQAINSKEIQRPLANPTNETEKKRSPNPLDEENFQPDQLTLDKENKRQLVNPINESETKRSISSVGKENIQSDQLAIENKGNERPLVNLVNEPETKKSSNPLGEDKTNVMEPVPFQPHVNHEPPARHVVDNCQETGSAGLPAVFMGSFDPPPPPHDTLPPVPPLGNDPPNNGPPDNGPPDEPEANGHGQVAILVENNENEESSNYAYEFSNSYYHIHFLSIVFIIGGLLVLITASFMIWIYKIPSFGVDGRKVFLAVVWVLWVVAYVFILCQDYKSCKGMSYLTHMPHHIRLNKSSFTDWKKGIVWIKK